MMGICALRLYFLRTFFFTLSAPALLLCAWPAHAVLDKARAAGFVPHKAIYDIRMSAKKSGAQVANITGKMTYEWQPSCDAWLSNHHFSMRYEYVESPSMNITSDFSTYESFDGKTMNFTSQRKRGGEVFEEIRGAATIEDSGETSRAVYTIPPNLEFDLPDGTLFPIAHTLDVLDKIKTGQKFYIATIFDGSDEEGPVEINSFIGKQADINNYLKITPDMDKKLLESQAWKLRLAFFPLHQKKGEEIGDESSSDYEMSLVFHENGVISDMLVEYDDFSVTQKLVALETLGDTCTSERQNKQKSRDNRTSEE